MSKHTIYMAINIFIFVYTTIVLLLIIFDNPIIRNTVFFQVTVFVLITFSILKVLFRSYRNK